MSTLENRNQSGTVKRYTTQPAQTTSSAWSMSVEVIYQILDEGLVCHVGLP